jgi:hypothetical protein
MHSPPPEAAAQAGVFSRAQALSSGWTPAALRHALSTGRIERVRSGVYAPAAAVATQHAAAIVRLRRAAAAVSVRNSLLVPSHCAATALHGLDLLDIPDRPCATVARGYTGDVSGVHLHRTALVPQHVQSLGRLRVTTASRSVLDVAREAGVEPGLVAADSALRLGRTSVRHLHAALAIVGSWPGGSTARRVAELADGRAESALESLSRLRILGAGLPAPVPQTELIDQRGFLIGRADFYWDQYGVVGEADGLLKYRSEARLVDEKLRQERLENAGLIVVRWGWEARRDFAPVAARLRQAFARGVRPDRGPRQWSVRAWYPPDAVDRAG